MNAVNWNKPIDKITKAFWDQNVRQFWVDEEIPISGDKKCWKTLSKEQKDTFKKALAGLTLLDTNQGSIGMPSIAEKMDSAQVKAVLSFMGMMEHMHAKSYSAIFVTLCTTEEIDELFNWVDNNHLMKSKLNNIILYYRCIDSERELALAMVASVFLESFLFYSGFFYPLLLAGQGKMIHSAEIINLIIRDESVHGVYMGQLFQQQMKALSHEDQVMVKDISVRLLKDLMEIEDEYTEQIYGQLGLQNEVKTFCRYNANKAMQNLGLCEVYNVTVEDVNPLVFNGLRTTTKNHDFFSTKGNGYVKPTNVEELTDEDFSV